MYSRCRLYRAAENNRHTVCYAAVNSAVIVCKGKYLPVFGSYRVIRLTSAHIAKREAAAEFYAFHCGNRKQRVRQKTFHTVKPRLAHSGGKSGNSGLKHSAYAVPHIFSGNNFFFHFFGRRRIKYSKLHFRKFFNITFVIFKASVGNSGEPCDMGAYIYSLLSQGGYGYRSRRHDSGGQPAAEMTASAVILKPVVLFIRRIIGVSRARLASYLAVIL